MLRETKGRSSKNYSCFCALCRKLAVCTTESLHHISRSGGRYGSASRGPVRQVGTACSAISRSRKHDDISSLKMNGPRAEQILSKMPRSTLLSNVESKVGRIRSVTKNSEVKSERRIPEEEFSENFETEDDFEDDFENLSHRFVARVTLNRDNYRNYKE